jgi:hypothetical protein
VVARRWHVDPAVEGVLRHPLFRINSEIGTDRKIQSVNVEEEEC